MVSPEAARAAQVASMQASLAQIVAGLDRSELSPTAARGAYAALDPPGGHDHPHPEGGFVRHFFCQSCRGRQRLVHYPLDDAELCPLEPDYETCDRCGADLTRMTRAEAEARSFLAAIGLDAPELGQAWISWRKLRLEHGL